MITHVHCIQSWTKQESAVLCLLLQVNTVRRTVCNCLSVKSMASHLSLCFSQCDSCPSSQHDLPVFPAHHFCPSSTSLLSVLLFSYFFLSFIHSSLFLLTFSIKCLLAQGNNSFCPQVWKLVKKKPLYTSTVCHQTSHVTPPV